MAALNDPERIKIAIAGTSGHARVAIATILRFLADNTSDSTTQNDLRGIANALIG